MTAKTDINIQASIASRYAFGESCYKLSKEFHIPATSICRLIRRSNIPVRSPLCLLNEDAFNIITEESAYWIGFLMADGCIHYHPGNAPYVSLTLAKCDSDHVIEFSQFMGSSHKLKYINSQEFFW